MEEEAPVADGGGGPAPEAVIRGVLEEGQAFREHQDLFFPEEVGSLHEALRSCCVNADRVQPDESQVKQLARALLKVVGDVRKRFGKHGDVWWLLKHLKNGCVEIIDCDDNCRRAH